MEEFIVPAVVLTQAKRWSLISSCAAIIRALVRLA